MAVAITSTAMNTLSPFPMGRRTNHFGEETKAATEKSVTRYLIVKV